MTSLEEQQQVIESLRSQVAQLISAATHTTLTVREQAQEIERLREELDDYDQLIQLQRTRSLPADLLWQAAHPDQPNTWPDLGDLIEWLVKRGDAHANQSQAR